MEPRPRGTRGQPDFDHFWAVTPDERIFRLAAGQFGVFDHPAALAAGFTLAAIRHRLETGRWQRLHRGVYRLAGVPDDPRAHLLAARLAAGRGAVVSHRSAAWLWGLTEKTPLPVHLSVPRSRTRRPDGAVIHRARLARTECASVGPVLATHVLRTLLDLACEPDARRMAETAVRIRAATVGNLHKYADRLPRGGRPELRAFRALATQLGPPTNSALESAFADLIEPTGIPMPVFNGRVFLGGLWWELDAHWPPFKLIVELDGRVHLSGRVAAKDTYKDNLFGEAGWETLRFGWPQIHEAGPSVVAIVRRRLVARGWHPNWDN
jgi:hypothetical protein